jgi:hypothetical protein
VAKINRVTYKVFGDTGDPTFFGQFGSYVAGNPQRTKDLALIQSLAAYSVGLSASTVGGSMPPALEDENSIRYLNSSMIAYLFQQGIAEWDSGTTYFQNSYVTSGALIYRSLQNNNLNNPVTDVSYWIKVVEIITTEPTGSSTDNQIVSAKQIAAMMGGSLSTLNTTSKTVTGAINELKSTKQDKLVAGENITIDGNTISAIGGGGEEGFPMNITAVVTPNNLDWRFNLRTTGLIWPIVATYTIDWGDGDSEDISLNTNSTGIISHSYSAAGSYNVEISKPTYLANLNQAIYGVVIDEGNSNPETSLTYIEDATGMQPANVSSAAAAAWDATPIFNNIRPCMFLNGAVNYYLDPNDFSKKADGSAADITSGNDGDVMIEIPLMGLAISKNGNAIKIRVTSTPGDPNFHYYAHTRYTEGDRQYLYIGAYQGNIISSKLYSLSAKTPTVNTTINNFRTAARNKGTGYDQITFYARTLLQALFFLRYKNLDARTALGQGYISGGSAQVTGTTNQNGMYYGTTATNGRMKCHGVEDLWGNVWEFLDGVFISSGILTTAFSSFNDAGSGYQSRGVTVSGGSGSYISKTSGTSETGFLPIAVSGSASTYYAAGCWSGSTTPFVGGSYNDGSLAGLVAWDSNSGASFSYTSIGARLMFL